MINKLIRLLTPILMSSGLFAGDITVTGDISVDTTWSADNEYILDKPIFVVNNATLTIEPGTTIYGTENDSGSETTFGSLIITRGAKIIAAGTHNNPIVFTALDERDNPGSLSLATTQKWGGLIVLGKAVLNHLEDELEIEGFPSGSSDYIKYGGNDDTDNSGVIRYVSIRYGGYMFAPGEEINGLTLGAVGSGTTIEYVEVYNNADDGIEFFGGTVNTKYMVMAYNEDESFDIDQGYRGKNQFWFVIQKPQDVGGGSDNGGEHDGGDGDDKTLTPFAHPVVYNATWIGAQDNPAFSLKDNFGGEYHNSIFTNFKYAIAVKDEDTSTQTTGKQIADGTLEFKNNIFWNLADYDGTDASITDDGSTVELSLLADSVYANPYLRGISYSADSGLDPRPYHAGIATTGTRSALPSSDGFFATADYHGAFDPSATGTWMDGWSKISEDSHIGSINTTTSDQDGDGLNFAAEIAAGTDPNDADTDNDGSNDFADSSPLNGSVGGTTGGGDTSTGGGDTSSSVPSAQIFGLSIRGGVYGSVMSGSLTLGGTSEAKNVLFRVKGPSMNFGGPKLANPTIKALTKASGSWQTLFEANDFGDHSSAATYSDRGTGNSLEPIAVISATPGTYSCQMNTEDGGTGNANMEIKGFEDENSSTYFQGISMRGYIGDYPMSGSLTIVGTGSVDIMFRVKGPSMNFGGEKLADPKIKLLQKVDGTWTTLVDSSSFGDHSSSSTYADRATGNSLEPMVVLSLQAGTYSCQASSDIDGGQGNANMEIKLVE